MVRVFYASVTGNTRKVADAIASAVGTKAESIGSAEAPVEADLLFLGAAVYATSDHDIKPEMRRFIEGLDPRRIGRAAVFCTGFEDRARPILRDLLTKKGIPVAAESFFCKGKFLLFNLGHPGSADLEDAGHFARKISGAASSKKGER